MDYSSMDFSSSTMAPVQVVVAANVAAITLVCLAFLIPGTAAESKNWYKLKNLVIDVGDQALFLLPALSALVLPDVKPSYFLMAGAGVWLTGVGISAAAGNGCDSAAPGDDGCTKLQYATYKLGSALQKTGTSLGVGALLAYVKDMGKLE